MSEVDVVVVGAGIAGSALAATLAARGISVLVLERQTQYKDKVRGEFIHPWGAVEMQRLGLEETLVAAGGGYCPSAIGYQEGGDPAVAEANAIPLSMLLPGVPGSFHVGHPQASEALSRLAHERGARVVRGVGDVAVQAGPSPKVDYELDGQAHEVSCRIVVGADGRQSAVRRDLGVVMEHQESAYMLGGLLVRGEGWPHSFLTGTEGKVHFLAFPRPEQLSRLYLACEPGPLTGGADRSRRFLDAFRLDCVPCSDALAGAEPAGPCAYVPGSDSWTNEPLARDGVVLIGDAAGWTDPIIGQGLSVALRDARMVGEVLAGDDWSAEAFDGYTAERAERCRRLRIGAAVQTELVCTFTPAGRARRAAHRADMMANELTLGLLLGGLCGPETAAPEVYAEENVERILSLA